MEKTCSDLFGEATGTALKTLKRDFGNPILISHAKLTLLFDQSQIKNYDIPPTFPLTT